MTVRVKLFGPQARWIGDRELSVELPDAGANCAGLRLALAELDDRLAQSLASSRLAINHRFAADDDAISPGDEVALIGMISGG